MVTYISFERGVLRILVCGEYPGCDGLSLRNICNIQFADCCHERLKLRVHDIERVVPVLTHDKDLGEVVKRFGGTIAYPINHDKRQLFSTIKRSILDYHPEISCYIKMLSRRGNLGRRFDLDNMCTWAEVFQSYNGVCIVDHSFKVSNNRD